MEAMLLLVGGRMKTNEEYIYEAVEMAWRWFRTKELRNSVDSGIRCMDIDDPWIISVYDLKHGTGPGVDALAKKLFHQTGDKSHSIDSIKEMIDSGRVVPKT